MYLTFDNEGVRGDSRSSCDGRRLQAGAEHGGEPRGEEGLRGAAFPFLAGAGAGDRAFGRLGLGAWLEDSKPLRPCARARNDATTRSFKKRWCSAQVPKG